MATATNAIEREIEAGRSHVVDEPQLYSVRIYFTRDSGKRRISTAADYYTIATSPAAAVATCSAQTLARWKDWTPHLRTDVLPSVSLCPDGIAVL